MDKKPHVPTPGKTPPGAPDKAERVDTIRKLMLTGQWVTGQTGVDLAKRWGLSISSLKADAAEASRSIGEAIGDREEVMAKVWGMLERARQEALAEPHAAARSRALQGTAALMMKLAGLESPQKVALTDSKGDDIPQAVAAALSDPIVARLYLATNSMPTDAEVEAERAKSGLSVRLVTYLLV